MLNALIKSKPAGLVIDPDFVQKINRGELIARMF